MNFFITFIVSSILTLLSIPLTIKLAHKFNLLDNPKERPHPAHVQQRIVPRAGGLACFIGIVISILIFIPVDKHILGIILGMSILLISGLIDDKKTNFSPYLRLFIQILAAIIVVASGIGISFITNPFNSVIRLDSLVLTIHFLGNHNIVVVADLLAVLWIVWMMNMINWSKGVDGQMPGIVAVTALILGLLSLKLFLNGDPNQEDISKLAFITTGSAVGFLIINWYPAKIFPGFSGSTILGFLIAVLSILSGAKLATAGLALLVPATDFLYTFFRRILQGKSPVWADRGHLHHKLLDMGFSHRQIALFYIAGSAILGTVALNLDSKGKLFAGILVSLGLLGIILWINFFGESSKPSDPDNG